MIRWLSIICIALLVGAITSYADIVHTPTDFIVGDVWIPAPEELFSLDLNGDGMFDFTLGAGRNHFSGIHPENQNQYLILPSPPPNIGGPVAALNSGYLIGSNSGEGTQEDWFASDNFSTLIILLSTGESGEFIDHRGYVGLEFEAEDGIHYGWLDIEGVQTRSSIRIRGWAYESTPGVSITAGAIPEPSTIGLFIMGLGALVYRRAVHRETGKGVT